MQDLFLWLSDTIAFRFQHYFNMADTGNLIIKPSFLEHIDWLQQSINSLSGEEMINNEEWAILLLALVPYLSSRSLDLFFVKNENFNQPYTEFGGKYGTTLPKQYHMHRFARIYVLDREKGINS